MQLIVKISVWRWGVGVGRVVGVEGCGWIGELVWRGVGG